MTLKFTKINITVWSGLLKCSATGLFLIVFDVAPVSVHPLSD